MLRCGCLADVSTVLNFILPYVGRGARGCGTPMATNPTAHLTVLPGPIPSASPGFRAVHVNDHLAHHIFPGCRPQPSRALCTSPSPPTPIFQARRRASRASYLLGPAAQPAPLRRIALPAVGGAGSTRVPWLESSHGPRAHAGPHRQTASRPQLRA